MIRACIHRFAIAALFALALAPMAGHAEVSVREVVIENDESSLDAVMFRPTAAREPLPAIVGLHGCAGLTTRGDLDARSRDWGEWLAAQGYLVLFPDSFGSRGLASQCGNAQRTVRPGRERVEDAYAAKRFLQGLPEVDATRVYLMGWSNGGSTVLYTVQPDNARNGEGPDFAKAVAFYPGCRLPHRRAEAYTRLPARILIGAEDNWTPPASCQALVEDAKARGEPYELVVYPDAHHGFDHPSQPLRKRTGLAYTGDGSGTAYVGGNPEARADARRRVLEFFGAAAGR